MFHCGFQGGLLPLMRASYQEIPAVPWRWMKDNQTQSLSTSHLIPDPSLFLFSSRSLIFSFCIELFCAPEAGIRNKIHPSKALYGGLRQAHWLQSSESSQILHVRKHPQIPWTQTGFPETTRMYVLVKAVPSICRTFLLQESLVVQDVTTVICS